jgi:excisionase family DNA binding protein
MSTYDSTEWLTFDQVAMRLQTTARTVSRMVKQGRLPAVKLSDHQGYRVRASDLDKLVPTEQKVKAES